MPIFAALTSFDFSAYLDSQRQTLSIGLLHGLPHLKNMTSRNTLLMRKSLRSALTTRTYDSSCEIVVGVVSRGCKRRLRASSIHSYTHHIFVEPALLKVQKASAAHHWRVPGLGAVLGITHCHSVLFCEWPVSFHLLNMCIFC